MPLGRIWEYKQTLNTYGVTFIIMLQSFPFSYVHFYFLHGTQGFVLTKENDKSCKRVLRMGSVCQVNEDMGFQLWKWFCRGPGISHLCTLNPSSHSSRMNEAVVRNHSLLCSGSPLAPTQVCLKSGNVCLPSSIKPVQLTCQVRLWRQGCPIFLPLMKVLNIITTM